MEKSEAEIYVDAISKSVQSICEDEGLSAGEKLDALSKSCSEFNAAVEKYNHNHDDLGRFSSSGGGGGGTATSASHSRSAGTPKAITLTSPRGKVERLEQSDDGSIVRVTGKRTKKPYFEKISMDEFIRRAKMLGYKVSVAKTDIDEIEEI